MNYLKRHKEIIPLIAVVIILGFAAYGLFNTQQKNSRLLNSGTTLPLSSFSGRTTCDIPTPNLYSREKEYSAFDNIKVPKTNEGAIDKKSAQSVFDINF